MMHVLIFINDDRLTKILFKKRSFGSRGRGVGLPEKKIFEDDFEV